jgi:single-strand DNA-binding protein
MSLNSNTVLLKGNLTQDPKALSDKIVRMTLAVDHTKRDGDKTVKTGTSYLPLVAFNEKGKDILAKFKKGAALTIKGTLHTNRWTDKEGVEHFDTEVWVSTVEATDFTKKAKKEEVAEAAQA